MEIKDDDFRFLQRVEQGDEAALVTLMSRHKEALFRFLTRYLSNADDAAEVTEETFLRVYLKASSFKPRGKVKTWIFAIGLNLARDRLRKRKKFVGQRSLDAPLAGEQSQTLAETFAGDGETPAEALLGADALAAIGTAIAALPEKLRFPLVYCVLEEHSYNDCAEVLKTNRKTVETRIYRARQLLRQRLSALRGKV
jgi:RNA polymerase sigma-70 factor (ECF subfamily)